MKTYIVTILQTDPITHNVKRFVVEKPPGYSFIPGQATSISINKPGLEDDTRPFTIASTPQADHLEFIIKLYPERHGLTEKLMEAEAGDQLIITDAFGTIRYEGPGLFIAGGTGVTPFLSIFRHLGKRNLLSSNTLLFANRTENDIIAEDELTALLNGNYHNIIEQKEDNTDVAGKRIDRKILRQHLRPVTNYYYVCGPDSFTKSVYEYLQDIGIAKSQIVLER